MKLAIISILLGVNFCHGTGAEEFQGGIIERSEPRSIQKQGDQSGTALSAGSTVITEDLVRVNFNADSRFTLGDLPSVKTATSMIRGGNRSACRTASAFRTSARPPSLSDTAGIESLAICQPFPLDAVHAPVRRGISAEVFVNGVAVGRHRGGYTRFPVDITRAVPPGKNVIVVRVNNKWNPTIAPRADEHVFSGGLYRDVWLTATDAVHVPWTGTPELSEVSERAAVGDEQLEPTTK